MKLIIIPCLIAAFFLLSTNKLPLIFAGVAILGLAAFANSWDDKKTT